MAAGAGNGLRFVAGCVFAQSHATSAALWVTAADGQLQLVEATGVADGERLEALDPRSPAIADILGSPIVVQTPRTGLAPQCSLYGPTCPEQTFKRC